MRPRPRLNGPSLARAVSFMQQRLLMLSILSSSKHTVPPMLCLRPPSLSCTHSLCKKLWSFPPAGLAAACSQVSGW